MKHVKLFEQFVNEKKDLYTAYVEDSREPGGSDKEIKKDYNLEVTNRTEDGFDVTGAKQDIEDFIEDYGIITDVTLYEGVATAFGKDVAKNKKLRKEVAETLLKLIRKKPGDDVWDITVADVEEWLEQDAVDNPDFDYYEDLDFSVDGFFEYFDN
jgi:hypothetical protein